MPKKKISYDLYGKLQLTSLELEVEDAYNNGISLFFADSPIEHPFSCDGFIAEGLLLRLLIEYKFDEMFSNPVARAKVLVQVLFYMKRFEDGGLPLPNVIMVGDRNECFVIHSNLIVGYLDEAIDWSTAPSGAAEANPRLVRKISENEDINPFVFPITPGFDIARIVDQIRDLSVNVKRYVRVTEHNIAEIFDYFTSTVLRFPDQLSPHETVNVFLGILMNPMDFYQHPTDRNVLIAKGQRIPIHGDAYAAFFDYYHKTYTPQEQMRFTEIADRLIEDVTRRRNGEFFTPVPFVDYAHRMIEQTLGEDWKERFVVWDCAAGTKNLTRDYRFRRLYCSTLNREDFEVSERYNMDAETFVMDFLNTPLETIPTNLLRVFENNEPIVFFINPPWGTANDMGAKGTSKAGMAKTLVNQQMLDDGVGASAQNLYAQFLYRIIEIKKRYSFSDCHIALFSPTLFLTGPTWSGLRTLLCDNFSFRGGIQFRASHFSNVSNEWGAGFTIWSAGRQDERNAFPFDVIERVDGLVRPVGSISIYNLDGKTPANTWAREPVKRIKALDAPQMTNGIKVKTSGRGRIVPGALGYLASNSNNIDMNAMYVSLFSSAGSRGNGYSVTRDNFERCVTLFAARKLVEKNWINSKNEYMVPDTSDPRWGEFVGDSIIFSCFHSSANQSSLRHVSYKGETYNIQNEFFFLGRESIAFLANEHNNNDCYTDAVGDRERFVYSFLQTKTLSNEAKAVLKKAAELVKSSFEFRQMFDMEHPEYQINNWDAGWYQIKALLKEYDPNGLKEFNALFKILSEKMRPMVYELGFLLL